MQISVVILTRNSEGTLKKCLKSVGFAQERIIIDDNSTDNTRQIALDNNCHIFERSLNKDFASQRNFGLNKARCKWVLFLDSDEYLSKDLASEIQSLNGEKIKHDGFEIKRKDIWLGKQLNFGEWSKSYHLRLGRVGSGVWEGKVHETWKIKKAGRLNSVIYHQNSNTLDEFVKKINTYHVINSAQKKSKGQRAPFFYVFAKPFFKFLYNFFLLMGFRDGLRGFVYSVLMSFHSFLSWSQLWLDTRKKQ